MLILEAQMAGVLNKEELLSFGDARARSMALRTLEKALLSADPREAVRRALKFEGGEILILGEAFPVRGEIYVLAFGKAACLMAGGAEEILGERIKEGMAVTKYGYGAELRRIRVLEAGQPVPDANSLLSGRAALELVRKMREEDLLLVLISGGGSSLLVCPPPGISLEDKIKANDLLVRSGAAIREINTVRKHLSEIKGGKLAGAARGEVMGLILSDVVGDRLDIIASGPTAPDPSTFEDARRILELWGLWDEIPESIRRHIISGIEGKVEETPKGDLPNVRNFIIGGGRIACEAAAEEARRLGLEAHILTTSLEGEAREAALAFSSIVEEVYRSGRPFRKPCALIAGGETTATVRGERGAGGPNQEFALSAAVKIAGFEGVAILAADTDGTDGPTDAAGGLVDGFTFSRLREEGIDPEEVLARHDAYGALRKAHSLLVTGPTGTNVNSIYIAVIL